MPDFPTRTPTIATILNQEPAPVDVQDFCRHVLNLLGSAGVNVAINDISAGEYETVAASQSAQELGATGNTGDYLAGLLVVPATTSPGAVSIKDGGGSAITVFTGGASSVSNLVPFFIPLGIKSAAGEWRVTTGANVSVIAVGNFS